MSKLTSSNSPRLVSNNERRRISMATSPTIMSSTEFQDDSSKNHATASAYPLVCYNNPSPHGSISTLGKPSTKTLVPGTHVLGVVISFLGLTLGTISILPNFRLAWYLGTSDQLILIGFLLSVMNLCLQAILPCKFLFEARFEQSRLQNLME
jgi:hypothetical protein